MRRLSRGQWGLIAAGAVFIGLFLVPMLFGTVEREMRSQCVRCGIAQYDVYLVVTIFGRRIRFPIGTDTAGAARNDCAHDLRRMGG